MNDFTKDELEFLKWCVRQASAHNKPEQGSTYVDGFGSMVRKIQSLIDNYCNHEWRYDSELRSKRCGICKVYFQQLTEQK